MALLKLAIFIVTTTLVCCESTFVDRLVKCSISDNECQKNLVRSLFKDAANLGFPELGIKPIDPLPIKDLYIPILNMVDVNINEGVVEGIKNCIVEKFIANFNTGHATIEILCDVTLNFTYTASSSLPIFKYFIDFDAVGGQRNGIVKIDKLHMCIGSTFDIVKRNDDVYIQYNYDGTSFIYDILGKVQFYPGTTCFGDQEPSTSIIKLLSENWKSFVSKDFTSIGVNYSTNFTLGFFNNIPAKHYIKENLLPYVVNYKK